MTAPYEPNAAQLRAEAAAIAESKARRPTLSKVCKAITMTVPWITLLHFDKLSHCFEASAIGVLILRSYGFDAKAIPAKALVFKRGGDLPWTASCGGSGLDVPRLLKEYHHVVLPDDHAFSEIIVPDGMAADVSAFSGNHVVIQCKSHILDLTIGQLNAKLPHLLPAFAINADTTLDSQSLEWTPDVSISWHAVSNAKELKPKIRATLGFFDPLRKGRTTGYLADAKGAVAALLNVNCNVDEWYEMIPPSHLALMARKAKAVGFDISG